MLPDSRRNPWSCPAIQTDMLSSSKRAFFRGTLTLPTTLAQLQPGTNQCVYGGTIVLDISPPTAIELAYQRLLCCAMGPYSDARHGLVKLLRLSLLRCGISRQTSGCMNADRMFQTWNRRNRGEVGVRIPLSKTVRPKDFP